MQLSAAKRSEESAGRAGWFEEVESKEKGAPPV